MLKISNLSKKFGGNAAVKDISLELKAGEIFSLIGPNGSGKTTILKIIAGLLQPGGGKVFIDEHDVAKEMIKTKARTGYIPDEPAIWPAMTGEEFLYFSGALYGVEEKEKKVRIGELLKVFNLENIRQGYFEDYSRGNKQKFTILAALLHKPKLLLIDEPIVGLDPVSATVAEDFFTRFAAEGGTILIATHTLPVAQRISSRIGVLKNGELAAVGSYAELVSQAKLSDSVGLEEVYKALA